MPQWLIQIDPLTTALTVGGARNGRKFREHEPQPQTMGKVHRCLNVLLLRLWVRNDQIGRYLADICTSADEMLHGLCELMGVDFATRAALPGIGTTLKA